MKECGRKLIGLRATPLLANSPIRLARVFPLLQVFYYQTNRCHTSSYKERQNTFIGSRTFCHFTSLHYQRSPILFLYLRILCFTHHLPIFRAYLSPFNQCHSHHPQPKRLSSPLEQSIQVQTLSALSSKPLQTEKDNFVGMGSEVLSNSCNWGESARPKGEGLGFVDELSCWSKNSHESRYSSTSVVVRISFSSSSLSYLRNLKSPRI